MASKSTSFYITEAALAKLDQLVISARKADGSDSNRSMIVEQLISAAQVESHPIKWIEPIVAVRMRGRQTFETTIGWQGFYDGRSICQTDGAGSKDECSRQLDRWVHEELSK